MQQFLGYIFVVSESFKHVQKTPKSWEKVCFITIFHQKPGKTPLQACKPLNIDFFIPNLFQRIMDKSLEHFCPSWAFSHSSWH